MRKETVEFMNTKLKILGFIMGSAALSLLWPQSCVSQVNSIDLKKVKCLDPIAINDNRVFPSEQKIINLKVAWRIKITGPGDYSDKFDRPLIKNNLVFIPNEKEHAYDLISGRKIDFKSPEFRQAFGERNQLFALITNQDSTRLIDLFKGKTISQFTSQGDRSFKIVEDSLICVHQFRALIGYSIKKNKEIWSIKDKDSRYYNITSNGGNFLAVRSYYNFRNDSTVKSIVILNNNGAISKRVDFLKDVPQIMVEKNFLYAYSNSEIYKIDILQWKIVWCRTGDINQHFILTDKYLASPNMIINKQDGSIVRQNNLSVDPFKISFLSGNLIVQAFDGEETQSFILNENNDDVFSVKYLDEETCIKENLGNLNYAEFSSGNYTSGLLKCSDGVYLYGFKLEKK
ncbi:MAG TPA: hypothetical protein VGK39_02745 [Cyclobacteriaceae bacterium]